jgi:Ca2+-binding EF-hand superfamily protein
MRPRRLFGITGIFCDAQVGYFVYKSWLASSTDTVASSDEYWWMVGIGMGVVIVYRICCCMFVYPDSLHAVAPRTSSAVETIVSNDRVTDLVAAVRFFSLCDSAGKGHVTEVELRRVLRALNGGERGTDDIRFDAAFLARDLMHQMDSAVDGKVYLHEFLRHASSGQNTPLTRLLLSKQMVRVLTAFTVADITGERLLERSQLGRFMAGTGLHMSDDDLDEVFLQVELDHSGRVDLFELLGFLTATREMPHLDAVPPAWSTSPSKGGADPVQILKIHHEEEEVQYPEPMRPKVTFAVPLDPRHVRTEQDEDEQLLPTLARGTRPFFRPYSATPEQKPKPDIRWRPSTAPSAVLGTSTYNLSLTEWQRDLRNDGGRQELIESAMRQIYDKCGHSAQKALNIFAEIDVDGSGEIDYEEFEQFLRRLGVYLSEEQVQWMIEELDRDGDGVVTESEWGALLGPQGWTALTDLRNKLTK